MKKELSKLKDAAEELGKQGEKLEDVNRHSKENLTKFSTIENNLKTMGRNSIVCEYVVTLILLFYFDLIFFVFVFFLFFLVFSKRLV